MLLLIGDNRTIRAKEIEAIFDYALFARSRPNQDFLEIARSEGRLEGLVSPASVVVAGDRVILSAVSPATLARRAARRWLGRA